MSALARAYKFSEIEENPDLVKEATKECFDCDPDNPKVMRAIARGTFDPSACPTCRGNRRQTLAAYEVACEVAMSKKKGEKVPEEDELFLEY